MKPKIERMWLSLDEIIFDAKKKLLRKDPDDPDGNVVVEKSQTVDVVSDTISFNAKKKAMSKAKYAELEKIYSRVAIHDYCDEYHLPDDIRKQQSIYYEAFQKVLKAKRKYKKLDEFVIAYRNAFDCLKFVAERNQVYAPEEFMKLVLKRKIHVNGLIFPEYNGKHRKDINWDYITQFILDPELDVSSLKKSKFRDFDDVEDIDDNQLYTASELDYLLDSTDIYPVYSAADAEEYQSSVIITDRSELKTLVSDIPGLVKSISRQVTEERKIETAIRNASRYGYDPQDIDDIEAISDLDRRRKYLSESDIPEFEGDVTNAADVNRYLSQLEEYEETEIKYNYHGKMLTVREIEKLKLDNALEEAGWNLKSLYNCTNTLKKKEKARRKDRKNQEKLKKRIIAMQGNYSSTMEFSANKKRKKKKKKDDDWEDG